MLKSPGSLPVIKRGRLVHHLEFVQRLLRRPVASLDQDGQENLIANQLLPLSLLLASGDRSKNCFELFAGRIILAPSERNSRQIEARFQKLRIDRDRISQGRLRCAVFSLRQKNLCRAD